ncbi:MAG: 2-C-methyl-D-erythritol 2,4-cyclodiphosphate synthase [Planctomycetia bacterium]|nr:2-C-methyl-D-erythritol 2,4-cyclodiphosphate synthase [Planctomycetia bacterium]
MTTGSNSFRVGLGHDTHRFAVGNEIRLGGVSIPFDRGFHAHSDGDVLLHAVTDALLGAVGYGDIGELFPDTDPANQNRDSAEMLQIVLQRLQADGWSVVNLDTIIFAEVPRLGPWKEKIKERLAALLGVPRDCVGVKAKTGESVGFIGRGEAISTEAIVLLAR